MLADKETEIYFELLNLLNIDSATMQIIISSIARQPQSFFRLAKVSGDFRIFYFEDENQHIYPIPLDKIVEVKNMLNDMTGGVN